MARYSVVLKDPGRRIKPALKTAVERELAKLAPVIASELEARRSRHLQDLARVLVRGVEIHTTDLALARAQAEATRAVLEHGPWMTAEEIGRAGGFSPSNLAAPAHRWKQEGKIFSVQHDGQERFPAYALDPSFRPLPAVAAVLEHIGPISGWSIAIWFESSTAWLNGARPRELIASRPLDVISAAEHYHDLERE